MRLLLAATLALALPLHAETYKWVDEKGVTHYSSTPPSGAIKVTLIEERVSVMPTDPSLQTAIADMRAQALRRQEYVEQEYLQRQRLAVEKDMLAMTIPECPYRADCGDGYFPYVYPGYAYPAYPGRYGGPVHRAPGYGYGVGYRPGYHAGQRSGAARAGGSEQGLGSFSGGRR